MKLTILFLLLSTFNSFSQDSSKVRKLSYNGLTEDITIKFNKYNTIGIGAALNIFPNPKRPDYFKINSAYQVGVNIEFGSYRPKSFYGLTITNNYMFHNPFQFGLSATFYNNSFSKFDNSNFVVYPFTGVQTLLFTCNIGYGFILKNDPSNELKQRYPQKILFQLTFRLSTFRDALWEWGQ